MILKAQFQNSKMSQQLYEMCVILNDLEAMNISTTLFKFIKSNNGNVKKLRQQIPSDEWGKVENKKQHRFSNYQ